METKEDNTIQNLQIMTDQENDSKKPGKQDWKIFILVERSAARIKNPKSKKRARGQKGGHVGKQRDVAPKTQIEVQWEQTNTLPAGHRSHGEKPLGREEHKYGASGLTSHVMGP